MNNKLPQNIEAEQSLLSAMLISPEACEEALSILKRDDFYQTPHKIIFKACQDLYRKKQPSGLVTVASYLKDNKQLEQAKGAAYLAYLVDQVPLATNIEHYASMLKNKALLRRLLLSGNEIISLVQESTDSPVEILDKAQRLMLDISCDRQGGYSQLSDLLDEGIDRYEMLSKSSEGITGISTGYKGLDQLTCGFQTSDLIVIAGRPSMGKTALMLSMARNVGLTGKGVGIFSLEMAKSQLIDRLNSVESNVNGLKFRSGRFTKDDWVAIVEGVGRLYELKIYIDDRADISHMEIRRNARLMKKAGVEIIFVDYLGLMVGEKGYGRVEEVSSITRSLKACAKELDMPVVALSQLNRSLEGRDNKRPRLSDLRDSGAIEQDADVVLFIYRDEVYHKNSPDKGIAELNIAKQRNGPTGTVKLHWNAFTTRFDAIYMGDDVA